MSRRKPVMTASRMIRQLMKLPPDTLLVMQRQSADGYVQNVDRLFEHARTGLLSDSDYELQYVDGRRAGRRIVEIL